VTVTNPSNNCSETDSIKVNVFPDIRVMLGSDTSVCNNRSFILDAHNPGATFLWTNGAATQTIPVTAPGVYGATVTGAGGCSSFDFMTVNFLPAPVINLEDRLKYLCGSETFVLKLSAGPTYTWEGVNGTISNSSSVSITGPGNYFVTAMLKGCLTKDSLSVIHTTDTIEAMFLASTVDTVNKPVQFVNLSQPAPVSQLWDFGDGTTSTELNPLHTFVMPTTFSVTLSVTNGMCSDRIVKEVNVLFRSGPLPALQPTSRLEALNFKLYPNPANSFVRVEFELNDFSAASVFLLDLSGKKIFEDHASDSRVLSATFNVKELTMGMYILRAHATSAKGNVEKHAKFIKVD
jgi:hypothetical protein